MVGAATVAAVASANNAAAASNAYAAGAASANYNNAAAYNAGVVAGATGSAAVVVANPVVPGTQFAMNGLYATLPGGCTSPQIQGGTYFLCGNTWFQPSFGANGVYYRVVPTP